ncbi:type IV toxin-antitoxin system AbiEi family antitoxin domain-containing protein [Asanoa siamensis]|uniref:AbiEi antitoxin N-terminal domain-containing protein n=1 Tax=Asanoa siamensis TaxID=926357 RepID=A0ABQ4CLZ4_9ACTN|nr:type IV toxin-antitoxin system AbiEi family antitoxin domain-containing protein [Asanoa siamensis]GIF72306.1 hypothetical protein Asi02nite_18240 [Asanoa siamensis]
MTSTNRIDISPLIERQHQIVTRAQLLAARYDDMAIYRRTRSARWQRVLPGVYAVTTGALTEEQRRIAAALYVGPAAQMTNLAALGWYGFRYAPTSDRVHMLVPGDARRKSSGHVVVSRASELDSFPRDAGLYRVCSPARAVVDAGRELREMRPIRAITAEAIQRGFTDLVALNEEVRRAKRSRTALIRRAVDEVSAGVRSAPEAELRECMSGSALYPLLRWNPMLRLVDGSVLPTPDGWIAASAIAIEVDSQEFHYSPDGWRRTIDRHNDLSRYGVLVLHFTPAEIRAKPARVRQVIEDAHNARHLARVACEVLTTDRSYAKSVNNGPLLP